MMSRFTSGTVVPQLSDISAYSTENQSGVDSPNSLSQVQSGVTAPSSPPSGQAGFQGTSRGLSPDNIKPQSHVVVNLSSSIKYTWSNLTCHSPAVTKYCKKQTGSGRLILNNVTGAVRSGQLLALMGSSGAGKTTLLNALNYRTGREIKVTGDRSIDGVPVGSGVISSISAYIQQDAMFFPYLKVKEHLLFCAMVRMPSTDSRAQKKERVEEVLKELGLWEIRNSYIGGSATLKGISGGEGKRLAFASEILTHPNILFADEPCSGLDSFMTLQMVNVMRSLAEQGKAIICTIHQPSSDVFYLFDQLCLLSEGRVAYMGQSSEALSFFKSIGYKCPITHNPADYYIRILAIRPDSIQESQARSNAIIQAFEQSDIYTNLVEQVNYLAASKSLELESIERQVTARENSRYRSSWCGQFWALVWRSFILMIRKPSVCLFRVLQHICLGFLLGAVYYKLYLSISGAGSMAGLIALCGLIVTILPAFAVVMTFTFDVPIFLREHWNGMYTTTNYFLAKNLVEFPLFFLMPTLMILPIFYMSDMLGGFEAFAWHCASLGTMSVTSCGVGYFCSCVTSSLNEALTLIPLIQTPILLFCGFFLDEKAMIVSSLGYLKYLSCLWYGLENMMIQEFKDLDDLDDDDPFIPALFGDGPEVLAYYNFSIDTFYYNYIYMGIICIVWRLMAYAALMVKAWRK